MDSMLGFKHFILNEMAKQLKGGKDFERHLKKYVNPHVNNPDSPLTTSKDLYTKDKGIIPKGSKVIPIQHPEKEDTSDIADLPVINENGERKGQNVKHISCRVITPEGLSINHFVPHTSIMTPTETEGKHNYEHAVKTLWNYSTNNKNLSNESGKLDLDKLLSEIDKSETDENHELHHNKSSEDEFEGKIKNNDKAVSTRRKNLKAAAYTLKSLADHPDFEKHFIKGSKMDVIGSLSAPLSEIYNDEREKNDKVRHEKARKKHEEEQQKILAGSTKFPKRYAARSIRKGDALVIGSGKDKLYISLKQQEAQGSSGEASETIGNIKYSLNTMRKKLITKHGVIPEEYDQAVKNTHKNLDALRVHMNEGNHKEANEIFQNILNNPIWTTEDGVNHLHVHMAHEAFSGAGKFKRSTAKEQKETGSRYTKEQGPATHMATVPLSKGDLSKNPEDVADTVRLTHGNIAELIRQGKIGKPVISKGKRSTSKKSVPSVMRMSYKK